MLEAIFQTLTAIDAFFWNNIAFVLIMALGVFLTFRMRFFQLRYLPTLFKTFTHYMGSSSKNLKGVHPIKVFFASVGGMIGIGNLVGIITALQFGGPGALFWIWIAALFGSIIKYGEVFLGLKHRVSNEKGSYDGGPVYFLKAAFNNSWIPMIVAALLCIYGVEIYQFAVLSDTISSSLQINRYVIIALLLGLILFAGLGGIKRLGKICTAIMPVFVLTYLFMGFWIIFKELPLLPSIFSTIFRSAFTGHAALGGFVGSSVLLAIQHGVARASYSADLGVGFDSIIQSESSSVHPEKQASLAVLGVFVDNFICTMSVLIVLITGLWTTTPPIASADLVRTSLSLYFPFMQIFFPIFLFVSGYSTIIAYFCVGLKCSRFLLPRHGEKLYLLYASAAFVFFSFFNQSLALLIMSISQALLVSFNLAGIFRLRKEILLPQKDLSSMAAEIPPPSP